MPSQTPSSWTDHQRSFHLDFLTDPNRFPRTHAHWRIIRGWGPEGAQRTKGTMYGAVAGAIWRLLRRRPLNEDRQVAVWPATSSAGTVADLVFEFSGTPAADEGSGELVGEWAPNGACCLLTTEGAELWPVYNPRRPGLNAPRR